MKFLSNLFERLFGAKKSQPKAGPPLAEASKAQTTHSFENVVVGKILEINKHPNADRLRLVKVNVGPALNASHSDAGGDKELEVVCGAPNIEIGQKVPVALVGAKLPNGMEIKEAEIRGVKSCGMLCAEDELGLGNNHSGIMILDEKAEIGMEFAKYINNR
jgi:phenylalanyl-tRNA synthetase beta chain